VVNIYILSTIDSNNVYVSHYGSDMIFFRGSWFQRHGEAYQKEWSVIRREDDVGGRARVTSDEERVLQGGWTVMRWCRYGGLVVVRTL